MSDKKWITCCKCNGSGKVQARMRGGKVKTIQCLLCEGKGGWFEGK